MTREGGDGEKQKWISLFKTSEINQWWEEIARLQITDAQTLRLVLLSFLFESFKGSSPYCCIHVPGHGFPQPTRNAWYKPVLWKRIQQREPKVRRYKIYLDLPKLSCCKLARITTRPTFRDVTTGFPTKCRLQNERRNSIPMTCHYPHLGSAFDWFKQISSTHDQSETVIARTLFRRETSAGVAKCRLFSQAKNLQPFDQIEGNSRVFCFLASPTIKPAKEKKRRNRVKEGKKEKLKKWKVCILTFYISHFKGKNMTD